MGTGGQVTELTGQSQRLYPGHAGPSDRSGVGLAMAKSVVQAHGGGVLAESQPNEGSRTVIELPLSENQLVSPLTQLSGTAPPTSLCWGVDD